jgi:hypothetical protein
MPVMLLIAGAIGLDAVIEALSAVRPVFHSEADFQHAFGQAVYSLDQAVYVRLEVRRDEIGRGYIDMICRGPAGTTAIEFKYFTTAWTGRDPSTGDTFILREHAATDLARRNFVFDIVRLERLCAALPEIDGIALMLSNAHSLWEPPRTQRATNDHQFRIHEGKTLTGTLEWASGAYPKNQRHLTGTYPLRWHAYSQLPGRNGTFRWLAAAIGGNPHHRTP